MIRSFKGIKPEVADTCYIDETALVIGDVSMGENSSVWPMTVIRGDVNQIKIGANTNIQDACILHVSHKGAYNLKGGALRVGDNVTVGHRVVLHACTIGNSCLIGMGSIVMDDVVIEPHVMLGAGALVTGGKTLESGYLWLGNPVKRVRKLSQKEIEFLDYSAMHYVKLKNETILS